MFEMKLMKLTWFWAALQPKADKRKWNVRLLKTFWAFFFEESDFLTTASHREFELFVEDGVQSVSEHFGLAGSGFIGQDVDFDVRVRASSQVHGLQALGFLYPHRELEDRKQTGTDFQQDAENSTDFTHQRVFPQETQEVLPQEYSFFLNNTL